MGSRISWVICLVFFLSWPSTDARKIVIFERGPWIVRQEISDGGLFIKEESHGVVFVGEVQELAPRLAIVKEKLTEGLSKMLNVAPFVDGFPLKDTVSRREIGFAFHGSPFKLICNACMEVSKQAEQALSDPETLKNIEELAKNVCKALPSNFSAQCDEMSQMYIQETISMLQDYLSEDKLCISTGLCSGNNANDVEMKLRRNQKTFPLNVGDDTTCAVCENLIEEAIYYVSENKTQLEILSALHQTCSNLKVFSTECDSLVDYYASLFFEGIATVKPKEFCQKINYCSSSYTLRRQQNCDLCRAAMAEVEADLEDPETKMKMIEMMLDGCKRVPNYAKECKALVFEYGPLILTNVEKYLDTNDVCSEIHVCEPVVGKLEKNIDDTVHPVIELPSSESSPYASS